MSPSLESSIERLRSAGWKCVRSGAPIRVPDELLDRYPWIPDEVREVFAEFREIVSPDEKFWLLTSADYSGCSDSAFAWNEWELQSIEAAEEDEDWIQQIRAFWDEHLPIAASVRDGYAYHALRRDGTVVRGQEPEFEETSPSSLSYTGFLSLIAQRE